MADEKITLADWGKAYTLNQLGAIVSESSQFLPAPVWATQGKVFAVKISSVGITIVTPKVVPLTDVEGLNNQLGAFLDLARLSLEASTPLRSAEDIKAIGDGSKGVLQYFVDESDHGTIWSRVFVAGVLDP